MVITAGMVKELREKTGLGMMTCKAALTEANGDMELAIENLRKKGEATAAKRANKSAKEGRVSAIIDGSYAVIYEVNSETDFVAISDDFTTFVNEIGTALIAHKPTDLRAVQTMPLGSSTVIESATDLMGKIGEKIAVTTFASETAVNNEVIFAYIHSNGKVGSLVKVAVENADALAREEIRSLGTDLAMQVAASAPMTIDAESLPASFVAKEKEIFLEQLKNEGKAPEIAEKILGGKMAKLYKQVTLLEQECIKEDKLSIKAKLKEVSNTIGTTISVVSFVRVELGANDNGTSEE